MHAGEISLAHGGILFLDEAALFRSTVLQSLRSPVETGTVTVSRAGKSGTFPARFQLFMAINPCPCGNFGAKDAICTCTPEMVEKYWRKLTAPLLDRIDLRVAVANPEPANLTAEPQYSTEKIRGRVARARRMQWERNKRNTDEKADSIGAGWFNARLDGEGIEQHCKLGAIEEKTFIACMEAAHLSGRAGHGILRTARTIADIEGTNAIGAAHIEEAAKYRRWNGIVPDFL